MKLKIILFLFLKLSVFSLVNAQILECEWGENQLIEDQYLNFDSGNFWIKNKIEKDTLWRYEYNECGVLKVQAQIFQVVFQDSCVVWSEKNQEEYLLISKNRKDVVNGKFFEYFENGKLKVQGQFANGVKTGVWKEYFYTGQLNKIFTYNDRGNREGKYTEYFKNGNNKVTGQYKVRRIRQAIMIFDSEVYEEFEKEVVAELEIKTGVWSYYSNDGQINKQIDFQN